MGTIAKRSFIQKYAAKVQFDAKNKPPRPQRQSYCRVCGKPIDHGKYCKSCADYLATMKRREYANI